MVESTHPSRDQLEAFVHGRLIGGEQQQVETHVADCDSCCEVLRSVPNDDMVDWLRSSCDTSSPGETRAGPADAPSSTPEPNDEEIPAELAEHSRYRIVRPLGRGGMGVVYQAEHRLMERPVALKVVNQRLVDSSVAVERFRQEVKNAARLAHRNIVTAYDAEQAGELHFLVMEYVEGESLSELVKRRGRLSVLKACNYAMQAAAGLQHAAELGMVHRDIKPHNLMCTTRGVIKILDFGLSRLARQSEEEASESSGITSVGATVGTPDYIAPEQALDSRSADVRADIYGLGCTLYYMLAGRAPFPKGSALEKVLAHIERKPPSLTSLREGVPPEVIEILERMMDKNPQRRFQTPQELVDALKPYGLRSPRRETSTSQSSDTATSQGATQQSAPQDFSPLLDALEKLDAAPSEQGGTQDVAASVPISTLPTRQPKTDWPRLLKRYRRPLLSSAAAVVLIVVAWSIVVPLVRDGIAALVGGGPRVAVAPLEATDNSPLSREPDNQVNPGVGSAGTDAPDAAGWINLLSRIDPSTATAGIWDMSDDGLTVDSQPGAWLALPYDPPREYDFEVAFTRNEGVNSIALIFTAGPAQATLEIDAWGGEHLAGIQQIDGLNMNDPEFPLPLKYVTLENGRAYTARLEVRRDGVRAYLDNGLLADYRGDEANLSVLPLWSLPESAGSLGIGAYQKQHYVSRRSSPAGAVMSGRLKTSPKGNSSYRQLPLRVCRSSFANKGISHAQATPLGRSTISRVRRRRVGRADYLAHASCSRAGRR